MSSTHEAQIWKYAFATKEKVRGNPATFAHLKAVLEGCGYEKRGPKNLLLIQDAMESADLFPEPRLTALGLKQHDLIYFSLVRPKPYRDEDYEGLRAFDSEEQLEDFLFENFDRIGAFRNFKDPERQFKIPGTKWEVDILCRERRTDNYVVIELKFDKNANPITNLGKYLPAIDSKLAKPAGKRVKALVISPHVKKSVEVSMQQTLGKQYRIAWRRYRLDLRLVPDDLW